MTTKNTPDLIEPDANGVVRDAKGRTVAGHPGPALKTGEHSRHVRSGEAMGQREALASMRLELLGELDQVGVVKAVTVNRFIELEAIANYLGSRLEAEGPLTAKGRTKALLTAYLKVIDRHIKIAALLGMDRKATPINPLEAVHAAVAEANRR